VPALRPDHLVQPHPRRLDPLHARRDEIMASHDSAVRDGRTSYRDPVSGLTVFTADFLARRGYCCDSGCRHCPFVV
jgi:hypothetical protein